MELEPGKARVQALEKEKESGKDWVQALELELGKEWAQALVLEPG